MADQEQGVDGRFRDMVEAPFSLPVQAGLAPGSAVAAVLRARDRAGFSATLTRHVTVIACPATT